MLLPDSRVVLLQELRPPAGYRLDGAIATTFTLDLTAAVIPPLAFSSFATGSSVSDPVTLLESVRAAADRIDIFCQGGNIAIPNRAPDLLAFVEPMVHEVRRPAGHLFHPKVWFVRYVDEEDGSEAYRLLVLTRNLTHDRAWDVVVRLDSAEFSSRQLPESTELSRFLSDLPGRAIRQLSDLRRERVEDLAYAARYIVWESPADARSVAFHYLDGRTRPDFDGRRHLLISPFLNDAGVDQVVPQGQKATVISRASELERLSCDQLDRLDTYVLDAMAGIADDESQPSDETRDRPSQGLLSGLHAKLYVVEPWGRAERARVLIGSANATDAAFGGNVELLVELDGPRRLLGIDALMGEDGSLRPLVQPYRAAGGAAPEPEEDERRDLENRLRAIAEIRHTVTVNPGGRSTDEQRQHDITVTADKAYPLDGGWTATVELLTHPGAALHAKPDQFLDDSLTGVQTADISPFLSIRLTSSSGIQGGTVVLAELIGDPEDRLDLVLARQIDTPEKFLRFLYLILSLGNPHLLAYLGELNASGDGASPVRASGRPGVLELVLRALAEKPDALDDLGRLVERLSKTEQGRALLPSGFEELWTQAMRARRLLKGH